MKGQLDLFQNIDTEVDQILKTIPPLNKLEEVEQESFNALISSVIFRACEDFIELDPFSNTLTNEFVKSEGSDYQSAEEFLFNQVPSFGELGWTFEEACDYLGLDPGSIRSELLQREKVDPSYPNRYQMSLFGEFYES